MGYPGALGIDLTAEAGDFDKILAKVESTIVERGGADQDVYKRQSFRRAPGALRHTEPGLPTWMPIGSSC